MRDPRDGLVGRNNEPGAFFRVTLRARDGVLKPDGVKRILMVVESSSAYV